jgi:hypothetical protein
MTAKSEVAAAPLNFSQNRESLTEHSRNADKPKLPDFSGSLQGQETDTMQSNPPQQILVDGTVKGVGAGFIEGQTGVATFFLHTVWECDVQVHKAAPSGAERRQRGRVPACICDHFHVSGLGVGRSHHVDRHCVAG